MMRKVCLVTMMTCLSLAGLASAAKDVTFGYRFEPGKAQKYQLKMNTEMEMTGMEASQVADMQVTVTCASAKGDAYTMNLVFDKVEASNVIGGNMQADPTAAQMTGESVSFTVDSHGEVSAVTPGPGFEAWAQVQQVIEPTLKNWYVFLPDKAVPVGGDWKRENYRDKSAGTEYVSNENFKFREMKKDKGQDTATVDQDVTTQIGGTTQTPVGIYNLAGTGKGKFEFQFDPARGVITYYKGSMQTDINMTPQSGGDPMKTSVVNHIERQLVE